MFDKLLLVARRASNTDVIGVRTKSSRIYFSGTFVSVDDVITAMVSLRGISAKHFGAINGYHRLSAKGVALYLPVLAQKCHFQLPNDPDSR